MCAVASHTKTLIGLRTHESFNRALEMEWKIKAKRIYPIHTFGSKINNNKQRTQSTKHGFIFNPDNISNLCIYK